MRTTSTSPHASPPCAPSCSSVRRSRVDAVDAAGTHDRSRSGSVVVAEEEVDRRGAPKAAGLQPLVQLRCRRQHHRQVRAHPSACLFLGCRCATMRARPNACAAFRLGIALLYLASILAPASTSPTHTASHMTALRAASVALRSARTLPRIPRRVGCLLRPASVPCHCRAACSQTP